MKTVLTLDKRDWRPSPLPGQVVLITTLDKEGRPNVATKSWITMAAFGPPPIVAFGCTLQHATARNALEQGQFVVAVPGAEQAAAAFKAAGPWVPGPDRFRAWGITPVASEKVRPPSIAEAHAHLECDTVGKQGFGDEVLIFGKVVSASIMGNAPAGSAAERYGALAPFFFLEDGVVAPLGPARRVDEAPPAASLSLHILAVADLKRSADFYRTAFGFPPRVEVPVYVELELPNGAGLGLYQRDGFGRNTGQVPVQVPPGQLSPNELYFHVEDLDASVARLEAAGARLLDPRKPRDWGDEAAYYADPDGNVVVLARKLRR